MYSHAYLEEKCTPEPNTGCWIWTAGLTGSGYGAHQEFYEKYKGEIPKHMQVCHKCDNKWCVNPGHLFLGTQLDNEKDKRSKGRQKYKLDAETRALVKAEYVWGKSNQYEMAKRYGVSQVTISRIVSDTSPRRHKT